MKKSLLTICTVMLAVSFGFGATVESQNIVGFMRVNISGGGQYDMLSAPMQKLTIATGQIDSHTAATITDDDATFTAGEFAWDVDTSTVPASLFNETGTSKFYLEITGPTNSAFYGRHVYITNNTATTFTIKDGLPSDMNSGLANETYKIVAANRVRDVFGEAGSTILQSGTTALDADSILFWNGSGWETVINSIIFGGWAIGSTRVDNRVIDRDEGFFLKKLSAGATNLVVTGEVSDNDRSLVLTGSGGYDLMRIESVKDVAIGDTDLDTVFTAGTTALDADSILRWNGSGWDTVINSVIFGGWSIGSTRVDSTFILEAGKSYFVKRLGTAETIKSATPLN